jgi:hypothetical protein
VSAATVSMIRVKGGDERMLEEPCPCLVEQVKGRYLSTYVSIFPSPYPI